MAEFLLGLDGGILLWIQEFIRQDWLSPVVKGFTHLGDNGILWIALCFVLFLIPRTRRIGMAGALALCFSLLCTNLILKPLIDRPRPWLMVEGLLNIVNEPDPRSFPSGHTSAAFAAASAFFGMIPEGKEKWKWAVMALAALMGLSRLYVGVHYPSDVLAGGLVGIFCGWAGCGLFTILKKKKGVRIS